MSTFATLRSVIATDLDRHLERLHGDEIGKAVTDAIEFYSHERFWFFEGENTSITTVAGTAFYAKPSTLVEIDKISVTVSSNTYPLKVQTWDWYRDCAIAPSTSRGQPTSYVVYGDRIYLYPTPDGAYPVTIWGVFQPATLSADADTNGWTVPPASELIRAHAKADIFANRLGEADLAVGQMNIADLWLRRLRERTVSEIATGHVTPTQF